MDPSDYTCYKRCPECPNKASVVPCDSPDNPTVAFIGEGPGGDEDAAGRGFVGKAGQELNYQYIPILGLRREHVMVTNAVKCMWARSGDAPPESLVKSCSEFHLRRELETYKPKVVVLLGSTARLLLGPAGERDMDHWHGIPFEHELLGHKCLIMMTPHPAFGLYVTKQIGVIRQDFYNLAQLLRGKLKLPVNPYEKPICKLISTPKQFLESLCCRTGTVGLDTESTPDGATWCVTYSVCGGKGYMVRAGNKLVLRELNNYLRDQDCYVIHNSLWDLDPLDELGLPLDPDRIYDTMVAAYHRGLPLSLKTLAFRMLGIPMRSFDDLVTPTYEADLSDWILGGGLVDWPKPDPVLIEESTALDDSEDEPKPKRSPKGLPDPPPGYVWKRPQGYGTKFKRFRTDLAKAQAAGKPISDLAKRLGNWDMDEVSRFYSPAPEKSIDRVPFLEALSYACDDARVTLMLKDLLLEYKI